MSRKFISVVVPEDARTNKLLTIEAANAPNSLRAYCANALGGSQVSSKSPKAGQQQEQKVLTRREEDLLADGSVMFHSQRRSGSPGDSRRRSIRIDDAASRLPQDDTHRLTATATGSSALYRQTHVDAVIEAKPNGQLTKDIHDATKAIIDTVWDAEDSSFIFHGPDAATCKPLPIPPKKKLGRGAAFELSSSALNVGSPLAKSGLSGSGFNLHGSPRGASTSHTPVEPSSPQSAFANTATGGDFGATVVEAGEKLLATKDSALFRKIEDPITFINRTPLVETILTQLLEEMKLRVAPYFHVHITATAVDVQPELPTAPEGAANFGRHMSAAQGGAGITDLLGEVLILARSESQTSYGSGVRTERSQSPSKFGRAGGASSGASRGSSGGGGGAKPTPPPTVFLGTSIGEHERMVPRSTHSGEGGGSLQRHSSGGAGSFGRRGSGSSGRRSSVLMDQVRIGESKKKSDQFVFQHVRCCNITKQSDIDFFVNKVSVKKDPECHTMITISVKQTCQHLPVRVGTIRLLDVSQGPEVSSADREAFDKVISKLCVQPLDVPTTFTKLAPSRLLGVRSFFNLLTTCAPKPNTHIVSIHVASPSQFFTNLPHVAKCTGYTMDTMIDKTNADVEDLLRLLWDEKSNLEAQRSELGEELGDLDEKLAFQQLTVKEAHEDKADLYAKSFRVVPKNMMSGNSSFGDNMSFGENQTSLTENESLTYNATFSGTMTMMGGGPGGIFTSIDIESGGQTPTGANPLSKSPTQSRSPVDAPDARTPRKKPVVQLLDSQSRSMSPSRMSPSRLSPSRSGRNTMTPHEQAEEDFYCERAGVTQPVSHEVARSFRRLGKQMDATKKQVDRNQAEVDLQMKQHIESLEMTRADNSRMANEIRELKEEIQRVTNCAVIDKKNMQSEFLVQFKRLKLKANNLIRKETQQNYELPDDIDDDGTATMATVTDLESNTHPKSTIGDDTQSTTSRGFEDPKILQWREEYEVKVRAHIKHLGSVVKNNKGKITSEIAGRWAPLTAEERVLDSHRELRAHIKAKIAEEEKQILGLQTAINTWGRPPQAQLEETAAMYDYCRIVYQVLNVYLSTYPRIVDRVQLSVPMPKEDPLSLLMRTCRGVPDDDETLKPERSQVQQEHELLLMEIRKATRKIQAEGLKRTASTKSSLGVNSTAPSATKEEGPSLGDVDTVSQTVSSGTFSASKPASSVQWPEDFDKDVNSTLSTLAQRLAAVEGITFSNPAASLGLQTYEVQASRGKTADFSVDAQKHRMVPGEPTERPGRKTSCQGQAKTPRAPGSAAAATKRNTQLYTSGSASARSSVKGEAPAAQSPQGGTSEALSRHSLLQRQVICGQKKVTKISY